MHRLPHRAAAVGVQLLPLPHALSHRVMCQHGLQRATQSALRERVFACVLGAETDAVAASVQRLWSHAFDDDTSMSDAKRRLEFIEFYQKQEYCSEGLEVSAETVAGVLALLRLQPVDCFVDLGSSEGRLPLAVAALSPSPLDAAVGIELSPWRHARACTALARVAPSGSAVDLHRGDFLDAEVLSRALQAARPRRAPQHAHTFWCGVRARQGRRVGPRLLDAVKQGVSQKSGGAAATARLLVAGFALGRPEPALDLHAAYVFVRASAASELSMGRVDALLPLFESGQAPRGGRPTGSTPGPRLVLEYHLHSCSPDASSVGEDVLQP